MKVDSITAECDVRDPDKCEDAQELSASAFQHCPASLEQRWWYLLTVSGLFPLFQGYPCHLSISLLPSPEGFYYFLPCLFNTSMVLHHTVKLRGL